MSLHRVTKKYFSISEWTAHYSSVALASCKLYREVLAWQRVKLLRVAKPAKSQGDWCRDVFVVRATRRQGDRMTMLFAAVHEAVHGTYRT